MWRVSRRNSLSTPGAHFHTSFVQYTNTNLFNRTRELDALCSTLKAKPQYSIISGSVNSGKSIILGEAMKRLKEETDSSVVYIDLRGSTFRDVSSFLAVLIEELGSWHKWLNRLKLLPHIKGKLSVSADKNLEAQLEVTLGEGRESAMESSVRLKMLFNILSKALPDWNWLRGYGIPSPVLVIDEANRLRALLDDERGSAALNDFFAWIVQNTKQDSRFHVMMASSDSFFLRWITQYVDSAYFRNLS